MDLKRSFIRDYLSDKYYITELCETYGISRTTAYKYINAYKTGGVGGLVEKSRAPNNPRKKVTPELSKIIHLHRQQPGRIVMGPKSIRVKLLEEFPAEDVPSVSSIYNELKRAGLIKVRRHRRRHYPMNTRNQPSRANEIWTMDYKGHFKMGNGRRCHPLTICDSYTRCLLLNKGHYGETNKLVKSELIKLFKDKGQPDTILSDNGSSFASPQSPCGYGSLSYWLIDHGITPIFSDPGRPGQNGRHERMHRELKAYCCYPSSYDLRSQNRKLNDFKKFYNNERPHHEIDMQYPGDLYEPSTTLYNARVDRAIYGTGFEVHRVNQGGSIRWGSREFVMITQALSGKDVGLRQLGEDAFEVFYRNFNLGFFELDVRIIDGRYYRLTSDRDLPIRKRNHAVNNKYK